MTIAPNTSQRDLVRLALLMCGDRTGAKYSKPVKGTQTARHDDPTRGDGQVLTPNSVVKVAPMPALVGTPSWMPMPISR
jgi:hypothetical protein